MTQFYKVDEAEEAAWNIHPSIIAARPAPKVAGGARGCFETVALGVCVHSFQFFHLPTVRTFAKCESR